MSVPTYNNLFNPVLTAMKNLGGSARNNEIENEVVKILNLSDDDVNKIHKGNRTKLEYNLSWARTYLKRYGLIEQSARSVWYLTPKGLNTDAVNSTEVKRFFTRNNKDDYYYVVETNNQRDIINLDESWEDKLISVLKTMDPFAFERLSQRLLKEAGFENVEITKKSGDGGIDGKGTLKIGSLVSFNVYFQSKRYKDTVSSSVIRDFRGSIMGRADKGIIITTGVFSNEAKNEARRDGALMIDLIDGIELAHKLKEYNLGVKIIEQVEIIDDWFKNI